MDNISRFCTARLMDIKLEEAFTAYAKSTYAAKFSIGNGDTVRALVGKLTMEEVGELWNQFVNDLKKYLTSEQ